MLVLSRKVGESLTVGNEITVTVVGIKSNQVRFAINAPREVAVHREEIYHRIAAEKKLDAQSATSEIEMQKTPADS